MKKNPFCEYQIIFYLFSLSFAVFAPLSAKAVGATLTLDQYLGEVLHNSPGVQASHETITGTEQASKEGDLPVIPRLFLNGNHTIDHREFSVSFLGGRTIQDNYTLGVEENFNFGLDATVSYNLLNNNTTSLPAEFFVNGANVYSSGQFQIDLKQSLWRNFFGEETRAIQTQSESSQLANHFQESFKLKQTISQAETAYANLAITNELTKVRQELLERSKKILDWNIRRVRDHLTDKVDELQSQADYQSRELELLNSQDLTKTAKTNFNTLRDQPGEDVNDDVVLPSVDQALALNVPEKAEVTDDIKAAEQTERKTKADNELSFQKAQPDLQLLATAAYNGMNTYLSPALSQSFTTNNPYYSIGVRFSFPIFFWETAEIRAGRVKQQLAAEHNTVQTRLNTDQTWRDLARRFNLAKERLKLATSLVAKQKEKMDYERHRLDLGRTTTYQVLVFEQDYALATISSLTIEQELLNLHAQLKVYAKD